jgi:hypothetical protein
MTTTTVLDRIKLRIGGGRDPPVPSSPTECTSRSRTRCQRRLHLRKYIYAELDDGMDDEQEIRLENWLHAVGFTEHPFKHTEAEQDPRLHEYFVEPACFDRVQGTVVSPQTAVLFAPRGGGKTANRVMVDHFCKISADVRGMDAAVERQRTGAIDQGKLRRVLVERFNEEELRNFCADLSVDYGCLGGEGKEAKIRGLLAYLGRRRRIPDLIGVGERLRPDVPWQDLIGVAQKAAPASQDALRSQPQASGRIQGNVLSITYTKFDNLLHLFAHGAYGVCWRGTVHDHVAEILKRAVWDIVESLETGRLTLVGQAGGARKSLLLVLGAYSGTGSLRRVLASLPEIMSEPAETRQLVLQAHEQRQSSGANPLHNFEALVAALAALGVGAVYVLVDRVDEFDPASFDPMAGTLFLSPLLSHLSLLEMEHVAFKFFLPSHLKSILLDKGILRSDRLVVEEIVWSDEDLLKTLRSRLYVFSEGQVPSMEPLFVSPQLAEEAEERLVACAEGSPRDLVLACDQLFSTYVQHFLTIDEPRIGRDALEAAIDSFAHERARWRPTPSRPIGFIPN